MSQFKQKTINSLVWNTGSRVGRLFLTFIINVILARLLSPREFGLVAMVTVITTFANIFAELGFSAALIQKKEIEPKHLSSVFWLNLASGIILTILFVLFAPYIAAFYDEPLLIPLTTILSLNFLIGSLNVVQNTLLVKSLNFRTLSVVEIVAVLISGTCAIVMAYTGLGVWSLAVQPVMLSIITALLLWKFNPWRPQFMFEWSAIKDLIGFSLNLFGTNLLNYWVRNIDYVLIGRFLGSSPLGIYNKSYEVMLFPLISVSRVFSKVMFPSFSIIQDDKDRVKRIYLKVTRTVALFTFPMMLGLFVTVEPFVLSFFGPKWVEMIPILRILSLIGLTQSIGTLNGNLYLSQGKANLQFKIGLLLKTSVIIAIVIGLQWGIQGVATGYAIVSFINSYPSFYFAGKLVGLTYWELLKNLSGLFASALTMGFFVFGIGILLPVDWSYWSILIIQIIAGITIYLMLIHIFRLRAYVELRDLVIENVRPYLETQFASR